MITGTRKSHHGAGVLQGTNVEMYSLHVITDEIAVACRSEGDSIKCTPWGSRAGGKAYRCMVIVPIKLVIQHKKN